MGTVDFEYSQVSSILDLRYFSLRRLAASFIGIFGVLWLFVEPSSFFLFSQIQNGLTCYMVLVVAAFILSMRTALPRNRVSARISGLDSTVTIKVGNLFNEQGHLVIGTNDVFDTALGEFIKPSSIQGQFLTNIYDGNKNRLDIDIDHALMKIGAQGKDDPKKKTGKIRRYNIGTTIALGASRTKFFMTVYGRMDNDSNCISSYQDILIALGKLWEMVRREGHGKKVICPLLGSGLSSTGLSRVEFAQMIISSFVWASKQGFVAEELVLIIHPKDLKLITPYQMDVYLKTINQ
jgi:hypothetical protein